MGKQGRYRKVFACMYGDEKYRRLTSPQPCGKALWWELIAGKQTGIIPGLMEIGEAAFAEQLGWSLEGFRGAFAEILREGMAKADWKARVIWVPNGIKYNRPESPNVIKSWREAWRLMPECELKLEAYLALEEAVKDMGKAFREAFREALTKAYQEGFPEALTKDYREPASSKQEQQTGTAAAANARKNSPAVEETSTAVLTEPLIAAAAAAEESKTDAKTLEALEELGMPAAVRGIAGNNASLAEAALLHCRWRFAQRRAVVSKGGYFVALFNDPEKSSFWQDDDLQWHPPPGEPPDKSRGSKEHPRVAEHLANIHAFDALPSADVKRIEDFVRLRAPLFANVSSAHQGFRTECIAVSVQWRKEGKL